MTIIHVVLFQMKPSLDAVGVKEVCDNMLGLKDKCISPTTGKPYILKSSGGRDNSPEGLQHGMTHGFVVEFASKEDRDYYLFDDPVHQAFKDDVVTKVDGITVVDYDVNVF